MNKLYYSYEMCKNDTIKLVNLVKDFKAEAFISVARGGLTLSHLMAQALNQRDIFSINSISYDRKNQKDSVEIFNIPDLSSYKKVLIIDDIVDSGKTMVEILKLLNNRFPNCEFKLATLFYKPTALIKPDFYINKTDIWIEFFWEVDIKGD
ncbi:phosphoribosyltransferase [Aliarcobacter skirrowii]|uniref:Phosphoribosyltransferase family protein n=1 Tax=Aliarcobacter skirrowii TaxID=28200 RepID=A0AAW9DA49_9BACT|nr:phosphoribosyltransferase family protein [Aliarcobacter skirrowii]AZL54082.1 phosphoribosyltransferase [Aliarcobacter skirrowii]MDX4039373.1 phosphoribosyltransferase family protein [Aliarcobacter skirrowii]MDX4061755.1 phosphoribosyltransferase family protein [Aliarcobacter skirrowii]MDX4069089.1 phosphoribosyltransferase family protein [Aliarcobacter skirrowii]MDY0179699.1 phosphoribosyltransferase family protein [Aliarcobacter skirrowii]